MCCGWLPGVQFFLAVPSEGITRDDLKKKMGHNIVNIGLNWAMKNKWVEIKKQLVFRKVENVEDKVKDLLKKIEYGEVVDNKEDIDALKKRKLITLQTWKAYSLRKGPKCAPERKKAATDLSREHQQRGD